ncbi:DnaJ-like [Parasponia andersonii]|uniref:DnaJ-like n=1 Tax=Parasponia andersonii TaxID=3476 RepID=A0A2P5C4Y8_PARAD|nr:DnaJ-like [Parasponia andersonii]
MAARLARTVSSSLSSLVRRSTADDSSLSMMAVGHGGGSSLRRASSSSSCLSTPSSKSAKPEKKLGDRLSAVIDAVNDRKLPLELRGQRNSVRSETDIINVVEQRIWHSMEEGQFENLPGKGKPLNLSGNPHADPAEDTLYRILSKNGCAPEWVELNKEIRNKICGWRLALKNAWTENCNGGDNNSNWVQSSEALKLQLRDINNMVFRYNLIVPFGRQMFGLKWEKELDRVEE